MHLRVWSKYHSDSDAFLSRLKRFCSGYTVEKVAISKFIQPIKARGEVRPIFHRGSVLSASCLLSNEEERGRGIFRWKINERICRLLFLLPSPSLSLSRCRFDCSRVESCKKLNRNGEKLVESGWLVGSLFYFLGFAIAVAVARRGPSVLYASGFRYAPTPARVTPPVLKQYRMTGVATVKYGLYANYHRPPLSSLLWSAFFISSRPPTPDLSYYFHFSSISFSFSFSFSFFPTRNAFLIQTVVRILRIRIKKILSHE